MDATNGHASPTYYACKPDRPATAVWPLAVAGALGATWALVHHVRRRRRLASVSLSCLAACAFVVCVCVSMGGMLVWLCVPSVACRDCSRVLVLVHTGACGICPSHLVLPISVSLASCTPLIHHPDFLYFAAARW